MRAVLLVVSLAGCRAVRLGEEPPGLELDAGMRAAFDATVDSRSAAPEVTVIVRVGGPCACIELRAEATGGRPPYTFEWDDGSRAAQRVICPDQIAGPVSVVVEDADAQSSAPHTTRLETSDASCPPPPPMLCLQNWSFEGMPAVNTGIPTSFDAKPWSVCTVPSVANTPEVLNDTIPQNVAFVPKASDGLTYLGMFQGEQTSQKLCESLTGGSTVRLKLDLSRIDLSGGGLDTERAFLEIWGGVATDCSQRELLWASPAVTDAWVTQCVTLKPQQFTDNLTLRARSDGTQLGASYVIVDHLVPVSRCP